MSADTIPVTLIITGRDGRDEYRAKLIQDINSLFTMSGDAIKERVHACFTDVRPVKTRQEAERVLDADIKRFIAHGGAIEHSKRVIDLRDKGDFVFPTITHP